MIDALISGNIVVDLIGKPIDRLPDRGRLALLDDFETHVGGNGPNTAMALSRLGGSVALLGRAGQDIYGRFLMESLNDWGGVDAAAVIREPDTRTGITIVASDSTGERSFIHFSGANAAFCRSDNNFERLPPARHYHYGSYFILPGLDGPPASEVLADANRRGMTTTLDPCWDLSGRWLELLRLCLPHVSWLMPSEDEARALTGEEQPAAMAEALLAAGARAVVLKLGEGGCLYADSQRRLSAPAHRVTVVDTTGAGDCFIAGFLYGQSQGWELPRTLGFANACGGRSVSAMGAVAGMAPSKEIEEWQERTPLRR